MDSLVHWSISTGFTFYFPIADSAPSAAVYLPASAASCLYACDLHCMRLTNVRFASSSLSLVAPEAAPALISVQWHFCSCFASRLPALLLIARLCAFACPVHRVKRRKSDRCADWVLQGFAGHKTCESSCCVDCRDANCTPGAAAGEFALRPRGGSGRASQARNSASGRGEARLRAVALGVCQSAKGQLSGESACGAVLFPQKPPTPAARER